MITQIEIEKLFPHPDNPRQDVGDVTELSASIKEKGVMQNLTAVKGGKGVPEGKDGYTVIIGHRRLEAAKHAGLNTVPCAIVEMSEKDQVATMLLENMQRSDLTVYEQAQGMQMMLDLGETQASISEKTGLSAATVSRRIKIAKLNKKKFKAAESRGGTIDDYLKCVEIKDAKTRNELLDKIGTGNFEYNYKQALAEQVYKDKLPGIKAAMKDIGAVEDENLSRWADGVQELFSCRVEKFSVNKLPDNLPKANIFYKVERFYSGESDLLICRKSKTEEKQTNKLSEKEKACRRANGELTRLSKQAFELRCEFVRNFNSKKLYEKELNAWAINILYEQITGDANASRADKIYNFLKGNAQQYSYYASREDIKAENEKSPAKVLLAILLNRSGDWNELEMFRRGYGSSMPEPLGKSSHIKEIYIRLESIGYKMSDMERQLLDGTHPAYKGEKSK